MGGDGMVRAASPMPRSASGSRRCSRGRGCRRAWCASFTAARPRAGARRVDSGQDLLHGFGRRRPRRRRGVRAPDEGLGARARRQGPDDRLRRREPRQRGVGLPLGRLRKRRPDLPGSSACTWSRAGRALHRGGLEGAQKLRVGDPLDRDTEIGPMVSLSRSGWSGACRRRRCERGHPALRRRGRPGSARRCSRRDARHADHARGDLRPGCADRDRRGRGRGDRARERLGLWARSLVWTMNRAKGERIAARLQVGMVWINDHMFSHGAAPVPGEASRARGSGARTRSSGCTSA